FEQFALLNAHEVARLLLHVPDLYVRQQFERRSVAILQPARAPGYPANSSGRSPEETNQAIRFTQRKCLQNNGFCFPGRHVLSACRLWLAIHTLHIRTYAQTRTRILTIRTLLAQCSRAL